MEDQEPFIFVFDSKDYKVKMRFDLFNQINQEIPRSLCSVKRKYIFNIDVSFDVFNTFITFWETDTFPEDQVTVDNIDEFERFYEVVGLDIIKQIIKRKREQFDEPEINLSNLRNPRITNKSQIEENIAKNLDNYIINYGEVLFRSPIHSLYNIFNHPERKLTVFDQLYQLIRNIADQTQNFDLYVLLPSINIDKLNYENQRDAILSSDKRFGLIPKIKNDNFFNQKSDQINSEIQSKDQLISRLQIKIQSKDQIISRLQIDIQENRRILNNISDEIQSKDQINSQLQIQCKENDIRLNESNRIINSLLPRITNINDIPINEIIPSLCLIKNTEFIKFLIHQNLINDMNMKITIKKDEKTEFETSLLYFSVENEDIELVRLLLNQPRINVNITSTEYFFYRNIKLKKFEKTVLNLAIEKNNIEIIRLLLSKNEINVYSKYVIYETYNGPNLIKEIQQTNLYLSLHNNNSEIINLLLNYEDIDLNYQYSYIIHPLPNTFEKEEKYQITALDIAIEKENIEIIRRLLFNQQTDINLQSSVQVGTNKTRTPLYRAIEKNNIEIVRLLLYQPTIDVNKADKDGKTPLMLAIENEKIEIVRFLLSISNIDINLVCKIDSTSIKSNIAESVIREKSALYFAVESGNIDIVKLLLSQNNIDVNRYYLYEYLKSDVSKPKTFYSSGGKGLKVKFNLTVLIVAIKKNYTEIVKALLEFPNIDVNIDLKEDYLSLSSDISSCYVKSPLYIAVLEENDEIVRLLLSHHRVDKKFYSSSYGEYRTALKLAEDRNLSSIIQIFNSFSRS